ncbi:hypothetical protein TL16_g02986, partial [Triparma laevis f. inornata]
MRPLTEDEMRTMFQKLSTYIGKNIQHLLQNKTEAHAFRLLKDRVYYVSESLLKAAPNLPADTVLSIGTCMGKFTKGKKFKLHITSLDVLNRYALYKVWVKPSSEMSFLYGNNIPKSGLGRITDGVPQYGGVIVLSMSDVPLGFGVAAQSTEVCKDLEPTGNVVLHQGDIGEYLRNEDDVF